MCKHIYKWHAASRGFSPTVELFGNVSGYCYTWQPKPQKPSRKMFEPSRSSRENFYFIFFRKAVGAQTHRLLSVLLTTPDDYGIVFYYR